MSPTTTFLPLAKKPSKVSTYTALRSEVRAAINAGKIRAQDAVERERVRTSWEVGKLIIEHIFKNTVSERISKSSRAVVGEQAPTKDRANYGVKVIERLSTDLAISNTELKYMVQFARTYAISPPADQLTWGHYRELLAINDETKRKSIAGEASKNKWTRDALRREIKKLNLKQISLETDEPSVPIKGKLDTYRVVIAEAGEWKGQPVIDLGFSNYHRPIGKFSFKQGDIVSVKRNQTSVIAKPDKAEAISVLKEATESDLFTYRASLLEFVDGDTIWLFVDLGFGFSSKQRVRLRAVNAPEINSRDGQAAKKFIERELKRVSSAAGNSLIITTTKDRHDQWDRYLVDVFYSKKGKEYRLDNELIKRSLAVRV